MSPSWVPCKAKSKGGKLVFIEWLKDPWDYAGPRPEENILSNFSRDVKIWIGQHKDTKFRKLDTQYLKDIAVTDPSDKSYNAQKIIAYAREELKERGETNY